jgi:peroxiredoxin (alkyl hydroperoxide reductase subunit C)
MLEFGAETPLLVGDEVPSFELETYDPEREEFGEFSLAKQKANGRWTILFFYPGDFTFVCATEFAALTRRHADLLKLGADLVTVSCDSKYCHRAWRESEGELAEARYPMAADPAGSVARLFGVYLDDEGVALRGTFLIDPGGRLMNAEVNYLNLGRNVEELVRKLKANLYLASAPTEVCPSEWREEGDATLKPDVEMVGRAHEALLAPSRRTR